MDRLEQLERGWLIYKLRWLLKHAALILLALIVGGAVVYWLFSDAPSAAAPERVVEPVAEPAPVKAPEPKVVIEEVLVEPVYLEPNYDFERELAARLRSQSRATPQPEPTRTASRATSDTPSTRTPVVVSQEVSLEPLKEQFAQAPRFELALEIAQVYLQRGDYAGSLQWALKANEIDNEDERSWAIYATASAQMGYQEQATNSLRAYLRTRHSERLSNLLAKLEQ